jgi:WD40 repeat protein
LWDLRAGAVPRRLPSTAHAELCFSPDSQFLVAGDKTHIRRWRCEDAVEIWTVLRDAGNPIACPVLWSPDGSVIAAATFLSRAALLDAETGALITRLDDPQPYFATVMISSFAFSPDGTQLAIGRTNCGVQLWDLQLLRQELAARGLEW